MLFLLVLCLCFTAVGAAFAETTATEAPAAEKPVAEMTAEELYQAAKEAAGVEDYGKALEYLQLAADLGNAGGLRGIGYLYTMGLGVEQDYDKALEYYQLAADKGDTGAMIWSSVYDGLRRGAGL